MYASLEERRYCVAAPWYAQSPCLQMQWHSVACIRERVGLCDCWLYMGGHHSWQMLISTDAYAAVCKLQAYMSMMSVS